MFSVRDNWCSNVQIIKDRIDSVIHNIADKENATQEDNDLGKSLLGI